MTETPTHTVEPVEGSARVGAVTELPSPDGPTELETAHREVIARMMRQAKDAGIALTGPRRSFEGLDRAGRRGRVE